MSSMKHRFVILLFVLLLNNQLFAQSLDPILSVEPIITDRPDQTESPFLVPVNYLQVETGLTMEQVNDQERNWLLPTSLIKIGLNDRFEFRLVAERFQTTIGNQKKTGLLPLTVGFKANLCAEKGLVPQLSFIGHYTTSNWGSDSFHTTYGAPSFRFLMQHTLSSKVSLGYNLGAEWDGESAQPIYLYTLSTGVAITKKLGMFLELYGFAPDGVKADHRWDGGFTYLINDHTMMDISGGTRITANAPAYFAAIGFSKRFNLKSDKTKK